ncbi:IS1380 family transposase ISCph9 [subsurface metagenome]
MKNYTTPNRISKVEVTNDTITGRGGLALFVRYLFGINLYPLLEQKFAKLRKSKKGLPIWKLFLQVFCFLFDGTSRHLTYFDELAQDEGYASTIEMPLKEMASSHTIKRFFKLFAWAHAGLFRTILNILFSWRLTIKRPRVVELTMDTMVMDNDEAPKRHGVQPTYKKVKGFQPLQMIWDGKIVDAVFRGGKKHSNYGDTAINMIKRMVSLIRRVCGESVLIVIRLDSGFFDEKILNVCDELNIGFIVSGKMYQSVKDYVSAQPANSWGCYHTEHQDWQYLEFDWGCDSWESSYRTLYTRPVYEDKQGLLEFARPDNVILTNLSVNSAVLEHCSPSERKHWLKPETLIASHHGRGADELPHRGLKDFGFEELPFKRFAANAAFYYCMLIGFFLHETFKEDVLVDVLPVTSYASTVRRKVVDIAAKIIKTGGQIILKVSQAVMESLQFAKLWQRCQAPPPLASVAF